MTEATTTTHLDLPALDALTGGAFTAQTSGERATRIREWLMREPRPEQLQAVFKELSGRDKGAAKPVRERLDELKRARAQEAAASEWARKAQALLELPRLNLADALAWQRDAAKAGAPLGRDPLAALKSQLAERVKGIEDLQNRVQVQREAAVLLAQRTEVLSTKPWREAQAAVEVLSADIAHWQAQAEELAADPTWVSVDARFPPLLEASKAQLQVVWDAFSAALQQAAAAAADAAAPLPPVPVWADELRVDRGLPAGADATKPAIVPPEVRAAANDAVRAALQALEQQVALGHGKASAGAAATLRNALKEHGRLIDDALDKSAQALLATAGELEDWQRWRVDQLRQELVRKAEALLAPPLPAQPKPKQKSGPPAAHESAEVALLPAPDAAAAADDTTATPAAVRDESTTAAAAVAPVEIELSATEQSAESQPAASGADVAAGATAMAGSDPAAAAAAEAGPRQPRMGGRKLQETLRGLREQWKEVDKSGPPNHGLWRRFDHACNEAHKFVDEWLDKVRAQATEHRAQRLALIDELNAWAAENQTAKDGDWKGFARILREFGERWRASGHLNEKAFAELQPQWKAALQNASAPLEALQQQSLQRRHAMIDEAVALGAEPMLRIDAVKSLQQRWQAEAQQVPVERRHEQKLWDAFRKPIDDAFQRKTAEREQAAAAMNERDRAVLTASNALEAANANGDAQAIRAAMAALDAALRGQAAQNAGRVDAAADSTDKNMSNAPVTPQQQDSGATENIADITDAASASPAAPAGAVADPAVAPVSDAAVPEPDDRSAAAPQPAPAEPPKPAPKPVVAVRGDDRPGMRKAEPAAAFGRPGANSKFGGRRDDARGAPGGTGRPGGGRDAPFGRDNSRFGAAARPGGRFGEAPDRDDRGPRLGDAAFRAQREALEHAQQTLKKLAAQAHGEALTELLGAWEQRDAAKLPNAQTLGARVPAAMRARWVAALEAAAANASDAAATALLRLEIAAEAPTPAEHVSERRLLQLQLLTRRNDPGPLETWGADVAAVLSSPYDAGNARRLQNALKALLRK